MIADHMNSEFDEFSETYDEALQKKDFCNRRTQDFLAESRY